MHIYYIMQIMITTICLEKFFNGSIFSYKFCSYFVFEGKEKKHHVVYDVLKNRTLCKQIKHILMIKI